MSDPQAPPPVYHPQSQPSQTSQLAIWSLVTGILGISIPAIILGGIGLNKIKKSNGALGGKGLAIAGIITGIVWLVLGIIIVIISILASASLPAYSKIRNEAMKTVNASNARQCLLAVRAYAADNGGNFPDSLDEVVGDYLFDESVLDYRMNSTSAAERFLYFKGFNDSSPGNTIILAAPTPHPDGQRLVVYVSSEVLWIDESLYQQQINQQ